jgi:hypothetical protein
MATEGAGDLFSYETLCDLVVHYSTDLGTAVGGCSEVAAAQDREEAGQLKARDNILQAFRNYVDAQTGMSFSPEEAETLKVISRTLETTAE